MCSGEASPGVPMFAMDGLLADPQGEGDLLPGPARGSSPRHVCPLQLLDQPPQRGDRMQALPWIVVGGSGDQRGRRAHARQHMLTLEVRQHMLTIAFVGVTWKRVPGRAAGRRRQNGRLLVTGCLRWVTSGVMLLPCLVISGAAGWGRDVP